MQMSMMCAIVADGIVSLSKHDESWLNNIVQLNVNCEKFSSIKWVDHNGLRFHNLKYLSFHSCSFCGDMYAHDDSMWFDDELEDAKSRIQTNEEEIFE